MQSIVNLAPDRREIAELTLAFLYEFCHHEVKVAKVSMGNLRNKGVLSNEKILHPEGMVWHGVWANWISQLRFIQF